MFSYYLLYIIPAWLALSWSAKYNQHSKNNFLWFFIGIFFTVYIGYRHQIGGDWGAYLRHFNAMIYYSVNEIIMRSDPGYYLLNWLMFDWGYEIYAVNLISGGIFMFGLIVFSRQQPNPWLAVAVAVPYLITVVAMGYTRQGVAIGFVFWGLKCLDEKKFKQFLILVTLAATFHKSAVLMIGLGAFLQGKGKGVRTLAVIIIGLGLWSAFVSQHQEQLWNTYINKQIQSQGAFIRVSMNLIPAIIILMYRRIWKQKFNDYSFWFIISIGSLLSFVFVSFASTAIDRIALYFTPIQVVVYARLPYLLQHKFNPQTITVGILVFYLLVLYVWLNFAVHAIYWVPYNNILFDNLL